MQNEPKPEEYGLLLIGEIVDVERKPYAFNGNSGTSYSLYVRTGSPRDGAKKVKVKPEQFGAFAVGERVRLPIDVYARNSDFGGPARLEYVLYVDYVHARAGLHTAPAPGAIKTA